MTKKEFIKTIAEACELSQAKTKDIISTMESVVVDKMKNDPDGVTPFSGFTFTSRFIPGRIGRNPATGEKVLISDRYSPKAKFGAGVKRSLNEK